MKKKVNAEEMQYLDKISINETGIPSAVLMENAGISVVNFLIKKKGKKNLRKKNISIISGKGNNGGDGFVIARHLFNLGCNVNLFILAREEELKGDALTNFLIIKNIGLQYINIIEEQDFNNEVKNKLRHSEIIIDAIFGTGFKGKINGLVKEIILFVNTLEKKLKIAVDVPSGILVNSNEEPETYFKADYTITFGLPKLAFVLEPVCHKIGKLLIKDISIPKTNIEKIKSNIYLINYKDIKKYIPEREKGAHKGSAGKVLIIGGSKGLTGAATLSSEAALKSGAGLVTLACPESLNHIFEVKLTECMTMPIADKDGNLVASDFNKLLEFSEKVDVIVFGPGIGRYSKTTKLLSLILKKFDKPLIIDADGLFHLAIENNLELLKKYRNKIILTPHYMEFSRLSLLNVNEIIKDKFNILNEFSKKYNAIVVLKGKYTSIAIPEKNIYVINVGNELLATGGSGDVLTGIIAGYIAAGKDIENNLLAAVYIHSKIADDYKKKGVKKIIASDIIKALNK